MNWQRSPEWLFKKLPYPHQGRNLDLETGLNYYSVLYGISKMLSPNSILEIGTYWGYSGSVFLQACPNVSRFATLDGEFYGNRDYLHKGHQNIKASANPLTELMLIKCNTHLGFPKEVSDLSWELIYVDGDHSYSGCLSDLRSSRGLLSPFGYILIDDVDHSLGVRAAVEEFCKESSPDNLLYFPTDIFNSEYGVKEPRGHVLLGFDG